MVAKSCSLILKSHEKSQAELILKGEREEKGKDDPGFCPFSFFILKYWGPWNMHKSMYMKCTSKKDPKSFTIPFRWISACWFQCNKIMASQNLWQWGYQWARQSISRPTSSLSRVGSWSAIWTLFLLHGLSPQVVGSRTFSFVTLKDEKQVYPCSWLGSSSVSQLPFRIDSQQMFLMKVPVPKLQP